MKKIFLNADEILVASPQEVQAILNDMPVPDDLDWFDEIADGNFDGQKLSFVRQTLTMPEEFEQPFDNDIADFFNISEQDIIQELKDEFADDDSGDMVFLDSLSADDINYLDTIPIPPQVEFATRDLGALHGFSEHDKTLNLNDLIALEEDEIFAPQKDDILMIKTPKIKNTNNNFDYVSHDIGNDAHDVSDSEIETLNQNHG